MLNNQDAIPALQIKLAALESLVLRDERLRAEYGQLVKMETERYLAEAVAGEAVI